MGGISATSLLFPGGGEDCYDYDGNVSELLNISGLTVELPTAAGWVRPVNEVSLCIGEASSTTLRAATAKSCSRLWRRYRA
jgi:hypothetical protein